MTCLDDLSIYVYLGIDNIGRTFWDLNARRACIHRYIEHTLTEVSFGDRVFGVGFERLSLTGRATLRLVDGNP